MLLFDILISLTAFLFVVKSEIKFNYTEGTLFKDYVCVSPENTLAVEFSYYVNGTRVLSNQDRYNAEIYLVLRDNSMVLINLYDTSVTLSDIPTPFLENIDYIKQTKIKLKNLDETFNNMRLSIKLRFSYFDSETNKFKNVNSCGETTFFLIPLKPKIKCVQLNHNFDSETLVECQVTSQPAVSIIPTFASTNITSYDLSVDQTNNTHNLTKTESTYIIKFYPNLSIVNSKMTITAILDSHYSGNGKNNTVHNFSKPLSDSTEIRLKYNNLLKMECTKMRVIENDFAFKCVATNMNNVDFSVEKLVTKSEPKIEIIKVGPWATEFWYRIRSDIDVVNKTVVVTVTPIEGGNSVKSIVKMELPAEMPPFNITFTLNDMEVSIHRIGCQNLTKSFNITCTAYSITEEYHTSITSPNGKVYTDCDARLDIRLGKDTFGVWTCHATNKFGKSAYSFMNLVLEDKPCNANLIYEGNVTYDNHTNIHAIKAARNIQLQCQSLSFPKPVMYSLYKMKDSYRKEVSYQSETGYFSLDVDDKFFSGVWKCSVYNTLGEIDSEEMKFMVVNEIIQTKTTYVFYLTLILMTFMISATILGFILIFLCLKSMILVDQSTKYVRLNIDEL